MTGGNEEKTAFDWVDEGDRLMREAHEALLNPEGEDRFEANRRFEAAIDAYLEARKLGAEHELWSRAAPCLFALSSGKRGNAGPAARKIVEIMRAYPKRAGLDNSYWLLLASALILLAKESEIGAGQDALLVEARNALEEAGKPNSGEEFHPEIMIGLITFEGKIAKTAEERRRKYEEADRFFEQLKAMLDPSDKIEMRQLLYVEGSTYMERADAEQDPEARAAWLGRACEVLERGWEGDGALPGLILARLAALAGDGPGFITALEQAAAEMGDDDGALIGRCVEDVLSSDWTAKNILEQPEVKDWLHRRRS